MANMFRNFVGCIRIHIYLENHVSELTVHCCQYHEYVMHPNFCLSLLLGKKCMGYQRMYRNGLILNGSDNSVLYLGFLSFWTLSIT
jgi:hypothetical protein